MAHADPGRNLTLHHHVSISTTEESTTRADIHWLPPPQLEARLPPHDSLGYLQTKHLADDLDLSGHPSNFDYYSGIPQEPPLHEKTEGTWRGAPSTTS